MNSAAFSFKHYFFPKAWIEFPPQMSQQLNLNISFNPRGEYNLQKSTFTLYLEIQMNSDLGNKVIDVTCIAEFEFTNKLTLKEIPNYFYPNSIAIVYPYIRSFVSTLSLQANVKPIVLPTINLSYLEDQLKMNTNII